MRFALALMLGLVTTQALANEASVDIDNFSFTPAHLVVAPGTKVTWTNHDDIPHTVFNRETPKDLHSPVLDTDDHWSAVLDRPGVYGFFCSLHPHMQMQVEVR